MSAPGAAARTFGLASVLSLLLALTAFSACRRARATADAALLTVGSNLSSAAPGLTAQARRLRLNGNMVEFSVRAVDESVERVISLYQRRCDDFDASIAETLSRTLSQLVPEPARIPIRFALAATDLSLGRSHGYVACLELGSSPIGFEGLARRLRRFARSWNLGEIGTARYVYVASVAGDPNRSVILNVVATSLDLRTLLHPRGEYLTDRDIPAPPSATRILQAEELGAPSSVAVYSSPKPIQEVVEHYERAFVSAGWRLVDPEVRKAVRRPPSPVVVAVRGGRTAMVVGQRPAGGRTVFALLQTELE